MIGFEKRLEQAAVEVRDKVRHIPARPVEHLRRRLRIQRMAVAGSGALVLVVVLGITALLVTDDDGLPAASTAPPSVTTSSIVGEVPVPLGVSLPRLTLDLSGWVHSYSTEDLGDGDSRDVPGTTIGYYLPTEDGLSTDITATLDLRGIPAGSQYEVTLPFWGSDDYEEVVVRGYDARLYVDDDEPSSFTIIWRESDSVVGWVDVSGVSRSVTRDEALAVASSIVPVSDAEWSDLLQATNPSPGGVTTTLPGAG